MSDELPTSFDALAHEHNLSARVRDICRLFFLAGLKLGRRQGVKMSRAVDRAIERDTASEGLR